MKVEEPIDPAIKAAMEDPGLRRCLLEAGVTNPVFTRDPGVLEGGRVVVRAIAPHPNAPAAQLVHEMTVPL